MKTSSNTIERAGHAARREFLSQAAALGSAAMLACLRARGQEVVTRRIGLGFSLYGAKSLTLSAALKAVADIGYDCVEIPVMPDWPADSARLTANAQAQIVDELRERGLRLTALMENLPALGNDAQHEQHLKRLERGAEVARNIFSPAASPPVIETILGGRPGEFEQVRERLVERMRDYASVASKAEVVLAVKAHVGNAIQRPEQLVAVLDAVASPWLKAAYDYSHFEAQGLEMRATTAALLPRTAFVHVKDTQVTAGKRAFLLPGEGTTDYVHLLKLIRESGYRGDVVVEVSSQISNQEGYDPLTAMRKCYNHLTKAFDQAGLNDRKR